MDIEIIVAALVASSIGGVIAGLMTASRARQSSPPRFIRAGELRSQDEPNGPQVAAALTAGVQLDQREIDAVALSDPEDPSRSALVEFLPESAAKILGNPEAQIDMKNGSTSYGFAYDAIVSSLPIGAAVTEHALQAGQMMRVVGYSGNLGSGALELVSTNGNVLGTVRDTATGQFTGQLQLAQGGVPAINPAMGALIVFQVMSIVTGQYYLHRIDSKLATINKSLDRIEARLVGLTRANVEVAREMTERIFRLMRDGVQLTPSDIDQLREAEQLARLAFHQSRDALITASSNWAQMLKSDIKKKEFREVVADGRRASGDDASILVYASAVLGRIALLRTIAESTGDHHRQTVLMEDYGDLRDVLKNQMREVLKAYAPFSKLSDADAEERFGGFWGLSEDDLAQVASLKKGIAKLSADVKKADSFLPEPAQLEPAPVVLEIRRLADGEMEVCAATARQV